MHAKLEQRMALHRKFWNGDGPSLLLIPQAQMIQYDTINYAERFYNPQKMWDSEKSRIGGLWNWPTDGIPCVRPNLGTVFIPALAGQNFHICDGQMPWPGEQLTRQQIESIPAMDIEHASVMRLALEFFQIHYSNNSEMAAYLPDTQGIFDIAHLIYGDAIFYEIADNSEKQWIKKLLEIVLELYIRASTILKRANSETINSMVHGHGTPQGVYFPDAGIRISEDTATLVSPSMIDEFVMPYVEMAAKQFGGAFVHYCGRHETLFERFVSNKYVRAIDLGNPEMYETHWLFEKCAQGNTVFYGKVASLEGEKWQDYITRVASLVRQSGVRCILRPQIFPSNKLHCTEMLDMWHQLTTK